MKWEPKVEYIEYKRVTKLAPPPPKKLSLLGVIPLTVFAHAYSAYMGQQITWFNFFCRLGLSDDDAFCPSRPLPSPPKIIIWMQYPVLQCTM